MLGHFGGSPGGPGSTVLYQGHSPFNLYYRPLQLSDYDALKEIHRDLFPIDYEEIFFRKAVASEDRVFSWAAIHSELGRDHLVGFITARLVYLYECDPVDRQVMGLSPKALDSHCSVYVLTLGVVPGCRQCGIARTLLRMVHQHATAMRCRVIFLHVISYNDAAMRLYGSSGYQPMARLPNFYHLVTGRQPNPDQSWYDSFLYATFLPGAGPEPSPAMQWAGGMLGAAVAPFRSMLGTFNVCMPDWLCRQTYSTFLPFASSFTPRTSSKGSLSDTATSAWHQQQQPQAVPSAPPMPAIYAQQQQQQASTAAGASGTSMEPPLTRQQQQQPCAEGRQHEWGAYDRPTQHFGRGSSNGFGGSTASVSFGMDPCGVTVGSCATSAPAGADRLSAPSRRVGSQRQEQHPHQHQQEQHPQHYPSPEVQAACGPLLRPPSPLVLPSNSPSLSSLQQRHPHLGGSGPHTSHYTSQGPGAGGQHNHHHGHHHNHHHHNHHHGSGPYHAVSGGSSSSVGSHSHAHGQALAHGHGRHGEYTRGGITVQHAPHGMAGGWLQHYSQQQQQGGASLLTSLFRPPAAQPHPHSK